jgi:acyl carrier protein
MSLRPKLPLDFFVLYSSAVSLIGSVGQANYAAANAFLDALAHYRQSQELPALSINWSAWAETGLARTQAIQQSGTFQGMDLIQTHEGVSLLADLFWQDDAQIGVLPMRWDDATPFTDPARQALFADLERPPVLDRQMQTAADHLLARQIQDALPDKRGGILQDVLRSLIIQTLNLSPQTSIDVQRPLRELGFDSLMSVELRNKLRASTGCALPVTLVYDYPTITALTNHLLFLLCPEDASEQGASSAANNEQKNYLQNDLQEDLSQLTDEELDALLAPFEQQ